MIRILSPRGAGLLASGATEPPEAPEPEPFALTHLHSVRVWPYLAAGVWAFTLFVELVLYGISKTAAFLAVPLGGIILGGGSVWVIRRLGGSARDIGWSWPRRPRRPGRSILLGIGAGVCAWLVFMVVGYVLQLIFGEMDTLAPYRESLSSPELVPSLLIGAIVTAPIGEELFYRGLLFGLMLDGARTRWVPILASAAIFSFVHLNGPAALQLFGFGVLLAWLRLADEGSLASAIAAHATNNALTLVVALYFVGAT